SVRVGFGEVPGDRPPRCGRARQFARHMVTRLNQGPAGRSASTEPRDPREPAFPGGMYPHVGASASHPNHRMASRTYKSGQMLQFILTRLVYLQYFCAACRNTDTFVILMRNFRPPKK